MKFAVNISPVAALALLLATSGRAEERGPSLPELADTADLVALAQVRDTDYLRRRGLPVGGSAYLEILIPYKGVADAQLVEVYESGLHDNECYFPNPDVFEEGRRYLVFLRRDPDATGRYRGLHGGCAVEVLVDRDHRYVVRIPLTGLNLNAAGEGLLAELARPVGYGDAHAIVSDEDLPPARRDAMRAAGQIAPWGDRSRNAQESASPAPSAPRQWIYTQGIPLAEFRQLLRLEKSL